MKILRRVFICLLCLGSTVPSVAQDAKQNEPAAGMLRYPDVSADKIVFSYAGDLWTVSREGGLASPLAGPAGNELFPRFSPDGKSIAFVGNYEGNRDIYTISVNGGIADRVTYHPATEILCDWTASNGLVFSSNGYAGLGRQSQLFTISKDKPLENKLPVPYGTNASISDDGKWLAYTPHSRDTRTWKRYRGGMASDVWLFNLETMASRKITDWEGTDSLPMFFGDKVYYVSDAGPRHRLNIWSYDTKTEKNEQVTTFDQFDCKWPSMGPGKDGKGEIVVQNGSALWLIDLATNKATTVKVQIPGDKPEIRPSSVDAAEFITSADISPQAKRLVVEARGDIWTLPVEKGAPKNLSRTSGTAERSPSWSPDGRWIAYFSDATGEYELYITQSDGRGETKQLTKDGKAFRYDPVWSQDSKHITFTDKTGALYLHTIDGETKLIDKDPTSAQVDVDWSHDSTWIAYARAADDDVGTSSVWIYNVKDGSKNQVTSGFFNDGSPVFDREGEFLYFAGNRAFNQPQYEDVGSSFIYSGTEVILAVPLRADVELPMLPENDEESWDDEDDDDEENEEGDDDEGKDDDEDEEASDDKKNDDAEGKENADDDSDKDPVSGSWSVTLLADEIPADQRSVTINLKLEDDGSVTGTVDSPDGERKISKGSFDEESGELKLVVSHDGVDVDVEATIKDGEMTGTVHLGEMDVKFEGTRSDDEEGKKGDKKKSTKPFTIDFENIARRTFQLPIKQGNFGSLAVNDKNQLIYSRLPSRGGEGDAAIFLYDMNDDKPEEKLVVSGAGGFGINADGSKLLVLRGDTAFVIGASAGQKLEDEVSSDGMNVIIDPREEWKQVFTDAWRIERDFFYDPTMHGTDWKGIHDHYVKMLDDCATRDDVGFVIGEMIAELNVGHAYYRPGPGSDDEDEVNVGLLGCTFELDNGRYKIGTIFEGAAWDTDARNPLRSVGIKEGEYVLAVNDMELTEKTNPYVAFQGTAGSPTTLTISEDATLDDDDRRVVVEPMESDDDLRFRHWIENNRKMVEEKTEGRVGYVYVVNTGVPGQNDLFRQYYGQMGKQALIIDDRWNGGGQIPTRFIELMNRPVTNYWATRDGRDWTWPPDSHQGPKCMLTNGMAGSGGDMFPALFRQAGIGKLIGMRTWGGLVGISGNPSMIDGSGVTAPTFAYYEKDGTWGIEGHGVDPDMEVIDDPAKMVNGGDPQLEAAIDHMLSELKANPYKKPKRPDYPNRSKFGIEEDDK